MTSASHDDLVSLLARTPPFSGFSLTEQQSLAAQMSFRDYPGQSVLLEQGSDEPAFVYLVASGQLQAIETSSHGVVRTFGEGSFTGQYSLMREGPLPFQVETIADSTLARIPTDLFSQLCREHPRVAGFFESDLNAFSRNEVALQNLSGAQFLFGTRLGALIHRQAPQCDMQMSVQQAARIMVDKNCDYMVVMNGATPAGLVTDHELRHHVANGSPERTVSAIMKPDPVFLTARQSLFEGLQAMLDHGTSHIVVRMAADGPLVGVITAHDVSRLQGYSPLLLLEQIAHAPSVELLHELRGEANGLLSQFYQRGVQAHDLVGINTLINDRLTLRVLSLSEKSLADPRPMVDFEWAWLSLGSEGRGEMCLKTDQDNALVFTASDADEASVQAWLGRWASSVNESLDRVGLTKCDAGMMAGHAQWRHRPAQWEAQYRVWLAQTRAIDIMQLTASCDLRAVHGRLDLERPVKAGLLRALQDNPRFLKHMAQGVVANRSPLSSFPRRIRTQRTERGRVINIKHRGLQPLTDFARIMALQARYLDSSNTLDRLDFLERKQPGLHETVRNAREAWRYLIDIRLGLHLQQLANGQPADDWLSIDELGSTRLEMLKAAFSSIELVQGMLAQRFSLQSR